MKLIQNLDLKYKQWEILDSMIWFLLSNMYIVKLSLAWLDLLLASLQLIVKRYYQSIQSQYTAN